MRMMKCDHIDHHPNSITRTALAKKRQIATNQPTNQPTNQHMQKQLNFGHNLSAKIFESIASIAAASCHEIQSASNGHTLQLHDILRQSGNHHIITSSLAPSILFNQPKQANKPDRTSPFCRRKHKRLDLARDTNSLDPIRMSCRCQFLAVDLTFFAKARCASISWSVLRLDVKHQRQS